MEKTIKVMSDLFVNRDDSYAEAFLKDGRMGYATKETFIRNIDIKQHILGERTLGVYQLDGEKLKWGCFDFDENTLEDFEKAKKLYTFLREKGYNPLMENSGGGDFKTHIWIFADTDATSMKYWMEEMCRLCGVRPHEIFPKQTEVKEGDYGNLVKLPLAKHLKSGRRSHLLNDEFEVEEEFTKSFKQHLLNKDIIPKIIIKEVKQYENPISTQTVITNEADKFFDFVLNNELPEGQVNDVIMKNLAIWLIQKKLDIEKIKDKYKKNNWPWGWLSGWLKKAQQGDIKEINIGELRLWCRKYLPEKEFELFKRINNNLMVDNSFNTYFKETKNGKYICLYEELAKDIIQETPILTVYGKKSDNIYSYNREDGLWSANGKALIKTQIEQLLGKYCKNNHVNEVLEKIKRKTEIPSEEFEKEPIDKVCIDNGVLDVKRVELLPFDEKYHFKRKLHLYYDKNAKCPKIEAFFEDTFYEEDIKTLQEWFGFHLYKQYFLKKGLIFFGPPDTAKTLILNILTTFIGEKNKSGISLQKISSSDKFILSHLRGKMANIYDDLSSKDLSDDGGFKIATGGGYISAEEKFGDSFEFKNYAKNTFACNKIPEIKIDGDDAAYYRRWLPIPCDNQIQKDEQDPFLFNKLTTPQEMSGLLNWALEGLQRIFNQGKFSFNKDWKEVKALMEKHSNHLSAFVQDCLEECSGAKMGKEEMWHLYEAYSIKHRLKRLTKAQLGRRLTNTARFISDGHKDFRYWKNVSMKKDIKVDIVDTFSQSMREYFSSKKEVNKVLKVKDIKVEKVSTPSTLGPLVDTIDTFSQKVSTPNEKTYYASEEFAFMLNNERSLSYRAGERITVGDPYLSILTKSGKAREERRINQVPVETERRNKKLNEIQN